MRKAVADCLHFVVESQQLVRLLVGHLLSSLCFVYMSGHPSRDPPPAPPLSLHPTALHVLFSSHPTSYLLKTLCIKRCTSRCSAALCRRDWRAQIHLAMEKKWRQSKYQVQGSHNQNHNTKANVLHQRHQLHKEVASTERVFHKTLAEKVSIMEQSAVHPEDAGIFPEIARSTSRGGEK